MIFYAHPNAQGADEPMSKAAISKIHQSADALHVDWQDGHRSVFHYIWLRDNDSRTDVSIGQNQNDTLSIPPGIRPIRVEVDGTLNITWADGGNGQTVSQIDLDWLREHAYEPGEVSKRRRALRLWHPQDFADGPPRYRYSQLLRDEVVMCEMLQHLRDFGFAILRDVPCEPGFVLKVVDLFGYVRETNYGKMWEIKVVPTSEDLGYTDRTLPGHVDKPYRHPSPTMTVLHFLSNDVDGGDSTLVDGFCLAEDLRRADPAAFELLSTTPVTYLYRDEQTELRHEGTIIGIDGRAAVTHVRMNPFSIQPFYAEPRVMMDFYAAYQRFGRMMDDPAYRLTMKLEPGHVLFIDNLRILHGRLAYNSRGGERLLQGCFSEQDSFWSKLAVLQRQPGSA
ncbi:MAG: TauD/TfdA family dioxygenase [Myxococcota bacterium]